MKKPLNIICLINGKGRTKFCKEETKFSNLLKLSKGEPTTKDGSAQPVDVWKSRNLEAKPLRNDYCAHCETFFSLQ